MNGGFVLTRIDSTFLNGTVRLLQKVWRVRCIA